MVAPSSWLAYAQQQEGMSAEQRARCFLENRPPVYGRLGRVCAHSPIFVVIEPAPELVVYSITNTLHYQRFRRFTTLDSKEVGSYLPDKPVSILLPFMRDDVVRFYRCTDATLGRRPKTLR